MSTSSPKQVFIIRHSEKLGAPTDDAIGGPDLSIRGSARAVALVTLFSPPSRTLSCKLAPEGNTFIGAYKAIDIKTPSPRFPTPNYIFATTASGASKRPLETITPLARALSLEPLKYEEKEYKRLASDLLNEPQYKDAIILICWHHGTIPALVRELTKEKNSLSQPPLAPIVPAKWNDDVFDRVWQISYS